MIGLVVALGLVVAGVFPGAPDIAAIPTQAVAAPVVADNPTPRPDRLAIVAPALQPGAASTAKPAAAEAPCVVGCHLPLPDLPCPSGQNCAIYPPHHIRITVDQTPYYWCAFLDTPAWHGYDCSQLGPPFGWAKPDGSFAQYFYKLDSVVPVIWVDYVGGRPYFCAGSWLDNAPHVELIPADHAAQID